MTQSELNRAVTRATRETVDKIPRRGFQPLELEPTGPEDLIVDWDQVELDRQVSLREKCMRLVA